MAINSHADGITIYFEGNTVEFDKSASDIKKALELLQKETKVLMKEFKNTKDIETFKKAVTNLKDEEVVAARSVQAWADEVERAKREHGAFSKEYKNALKQWEVAREKLAAIGIKLKENTELLERFESPDDIQKMAEAFEKVGGKLEDISSVAGQVANAFSGISKAAQEGLQKATEQAIAFESAFTSVQKTVDETETTSYADLTEGLRELSKSVPTTTSELAEIASLAGQMGVKADDIVMFTKAMVDFGNATNITAEQATQEIAQIYNVIGKGGNYDTLNNLLSTIVDLGNNSATTEKDIVEMFRNISASASRVGMTEQQMAALAATLASLGLDKGGASAISTIMTKIDMAVASGGDALYEWADAADMSVKKFKEAWGTDAAGTLATLLDSLRKTVDEGGNLNAEFEDLGIKELRRVDTMGRLVNANNVYTESLQRANQAFDEGTALNEEASKRYATVESKIQIMKNTFADFALSIGNMLLPIIEKLVDWGTKIGDWLNSLSPTFQAIIAFIGTILGLIAPIASAIATVAGKLAPLIKTTLPKLITANSGVAAAFKSVGSALSKLSGPIGILIGLIVATFASSDELQSKLGNVAKSIGGVVVSAFNLLKDTVGLVWKAMTLLFDVVRKLWDEFMNSVWGEVLVGVLGMVVDAVNLVIQGFKNWWDLLDAIVKFFTELLGISTDVQDNIGKINNSASRMGFNQSEWQSGGFMSGGMSPTFNNTFNVYGVNNVDQATLNNWADRMTDRMNENLGRRLAY